MHLFQINKVKISNPVLSRKNFTDDSFYFICNEITGYFFAGKVGGGIGWGLFLFKSQILCARFKNTLISTKS